MTSRFWHTYRALAALLLSLLLAGAFAQEAGQPQPARQADPVVILAGGATETLSQLQWRFGVALRNLVAQQGMPYSDEVGLQLQGLLPTYAEQRAQEVALVAEAKRRHLVPDDELIEQDLTAIRDSTETPEQYAEMLAGAGFPSEAELRLMLVEADIVNQLVLQEREKAAANISDESLKARYLAERRTFSRPESFCARHILVDDEGLATELVQRINDGEEFADLAAEYGTDGTSTRGGDLGCFAAGAMVADFQTAVEEAEVGIVSAPVQTQFGYHVILVYGRTPATTPTFEEVKEQVRDQAVALATEAAIDGIIQGAGIVVYTDRLGN